MISRLDEAARCLPGDASDGRRPLVLISGTFGVGGHDTYVRAHARAAAALGFSPHIFSVGPRADVTGARDGVLHTVTVPRWRWPAAMNQPPLAAAVVRFLDDHPGPHLIHGFGIWSAAGVAASATLNRAGRRTVAVASAYATRAYEVGSMPGALGSHHGRANRLYYGGRLQWVRLADNLVERRGYRGSKRVLVNYESVRQILIDAYGPGLAIRLAPYASVDAFDDLPAPPDIPVPEGITRLGHSLAPLVVAVSRHDPRKGVDVLLLALADLAARGVAFRACLVGPGRLLATHRRLADELGLADHVAILGRVADVPPYLRQADVFVLPSQTEASGSVSVLEALQCGVPVVASACDGIPEDLTHGVDSLLVAPGDPRALADALATVLGDAGLRAELTLGARRTYEQKFSASRFTEELGDIYAELGFTP